MLKNCLIGLFLALCLTAIILFSHANTDVFIYNNF